MGEPEPKSHLVILVHGIRDIARWQNEVGRALESEGFIVEHTSYGRLNLFRFLVPFTDRFRAKAVDRVWTDIQHAMDLHKQAEVSIIAHSFGTYVVTRLLRKQFNLKLNRLILCGAVVRYNFEFEQIQDRFVPPLLNDVGTADPWPAMAESLTTGYGSAGTFGFNRPGVRDRYHNGKGHGHFLNAEFARTYWAPFLTTGNEVPGDVHAESPPLWVRLIHIFPIKVLVVILLAILIAVAVLYFAYRQPPIALQFGATGFGFWNGGVASMLEEAQEPCPLPMGLCGLVPVSKLLTGRRYVAADVTGGDPAEVVSCGAFRFPASGSSSDPVAALEAVGGSFPQCVAVSTADRWLGFSIRREGMTQVQTTRDNLPDTMWLCGCDQAAVDRFIATY